jgi:hypothetical protein
VDEIRRAVEDSAYVALRGGIKLCDALTGAELAALPENTMAGTYLDENGKDLVPDVAGRRNSNPKVSPDDQQVVFVSELSNSN